MKLGFIKYVQMLFKGRAVVQEAIHQGEIIRNVHSKSSFKTTEFWAAVLTGLGAVTASAVGILPPEIGAIVSASSASLYAISRGLAKNGDPMGGPKIGIATTENIINLVNSAGQILAAVAGVVNPETAALLIAASNGAYGLSRGLAKGGSQPLE